MQICQLHWNSLIEKIKNNGMGQYISSDSSELTNRLTNGEFDPLVYGSFLIYEYAVQCAGLEVWKYDICPICEANKTIPDGAEDWLNGCVGDLLGHCLENGLVQRN